MNRNELPEDHHPSTRVYTNFHAKRPTRWNISKIVLWILVILAVFYEAVIVWLSFPHSIAVGIYIIEPLVIWGCITFIRNNGADTRTLIAILIIAPILDAAVPYGIYEALIVPLLRLL